MSRQVRLSADARRDIAAIARESLRDFGEAVWSAYRSLIEQAFADLAQDRERPGCRDLSEVRAGYRVYHLRNSRQRVTGRRIGRPRHVIVLRLTNGSLVVVRLLHERMLLSRHL